MAGDCRRGTAVPAARFVGDPVDVVTGAVIGTDREFQLPGPFELLWRRYYDGRRWQEETGVGRGFRFEYDRRLLFDLDGMRYIAPDGSEALLPLLDADGDKRAGAGFWLTRIDERQFILRGSDRVEMRFVFGDPALPAKLVRLSTNEHRVSLGYDQRGRLSTLADTIGRSISVRYDALGRMQRVLLSDPTHDLNEKVAAEYEYDDGGRLVRTTDPYGHHLAYAYDKRGRLTRFTDRNGYAFHYDYDEHGRCAHTWGDGGLEELTLIYDRDARMTLATRGNGGQWQYLYNDADALTTVIHPNGGITEYQYDDEGRLTREIDPAKHVTSYAYDASGALRVLSLPTGNGLLPGEELDPFIALKRRYRVHRLPNPAHDPHGWVPDRPSRWQLGSLLKGSFYLPVAGTRLPFLTLHEWDSLTRSDQPGVGQPTEITDAFGLLIREQRHDGRARHYHYDPNGSRARVTDFDGSHWRYEYALWNQLVAAHDPLGYRTDYKYDIDENLIALRDSGGTLSEYGSDREQRVVEIRRLGAVRERLVNDLGGQVIERQEPNGSASLRLRYDDQGLMVERALASGEQQQFEYGNLGSLALCRGSAGELLFEPTLDGGYNACDLRDNVGVTHDRTWGGTDTTRVLGAFELKYYSFPDGSTQMVVAPGNVAHRIRRCGSGVIRFELHGGATETVQFSPQGRVLAKLRVDHSGHHHDTRYEYSGEGDLLQVSDSEHGITRYEYDAAHRLIRVHAQGAAAPDEYEYDAAGNVLHMPGLNYFGHDRTEEPPPSDPTILHPSEHGVWLQPGNRLYRAHGEHFVYDERGQVSERRSPSRVVKYAYDSLDQLIAVEDDHGLHVTYRYDALGRRASKQVGADRWHYYWNGDRLAAELFPDGRIRVYVYADIDAALVPFSFVDFASVDADPADGVHYLIGTNHQGTPEQVVDLQGQVVWRATIAPFGEAEIEVGAGFHQPLRFPGHFYDAETGLQYNRYRYYVPDLGRYLQSDPIDIEGGHNLYAYAQDSNPLRDVDLLGLICAQAKKALADAEEAGLINPDGTPGTPSKLSEMTPEQQKLFCAARAAQLAKKLESETMGPVKQRDGSVKEKSIKEERTTINVRMVQEGDAEPTLIVSASTDNGLLPAEVDSGLNRPSERPGERGPTLKPVRNEDGTTSHVDEHGQPYDKGGDRNLDGSTDHHAEQRSAASTKPTEKVLADGPSKPCCGGCQQAIDTNNVHPDLQQSAASQRAAASGAKPAGTPGPEG